MKRTLIIFAIIPLVSVFASASDPFLERYVRDHNLKAAAVTVVIENLKTGKRYIYNDARAKERFLPASTFKIVNTLIALREGIVKNEKETIAWDRIDKGLPEWNRDQSIETAFPSSCVWFYQELAKKTGNERYLKCLKEIGYGNMMTGKSVDSFWLDGDLRISAIEQIGVMRNILLKKYCFEDRHYATLKRLMTTDRTVDYTLYAKTGWTMRVRPQIGWYVGFIETKGDTWIFVCDLDIEKPDQASFRKDLVYQALHETGVLR
jgi:beta-lactamase class D